MIAQRTPEWYAARLGKVTASRVGDLTARTRAGWAASRANYLNQLLAERLSDTIARSPVTAAMQWGIDQEADARLAYQLYAETDVAECGFVDHPTVPMSGASPDGLVGDHGLVEIKCPTTIAHLTILVEDQVPERYLPQIHWQLSCTGREWCDFVSYDPRLFGAATLFVKRVHRDTAIVAELEQQVVEFLAEVDALLALLDSRYGPMQIGIDRWRQLAGPAAFTRVHH
jgi:putative phage-type endonuclease